MALTETEELELLELENAEAIALQSPKKRRKKKRKVAGGVKGALETGEAALRGVTTGLLGAGDLASAAGDVVGGQLVRPLVGKKRLPLRETFKRVRENRERLEQERPVASGAGTVTGALLPISRIGGVLQKAGVGLKAGQPLVSTAKVAAGSAAAGGVTAAALGESAEDILKSSAVSGALGPVAGAVLRGGGKAVSAVRSIADRNKNVGFKALARALRKEGKRVSPEQLRAKADEFKAATGRAPSIAEIVGERGGQDILETVQAGSRAQERLLTAAEQRAGALQENLATTIEAGKITTGVPKLLERRGKSFDAFMKRFGDSPIELDADDLAVLLDDPQVRSAIPRGAKDILDDLSDAGGGTISLRRLEDIRGAFRDAGKGTGERVRVFNDLKKSIEELASSQVPEFGAAIGEFGRRSATAAAVTRGGKVASAATREFEQALEGAPAGVRAGARVGARTELADVARASPQSAARLAGSLAEDAGLARRLRAVDVDEATRLASAGGAETEALRSVAATVRGARVKSASEKQVENLKSIFEAAILTTGRASGGFQANFASRLVQRFRVPPTAAKKLAEAVTDPARTEEVIDKLTKAGISPSQIEELARAASRATSRTAGPGSAEGT